MSLLAFNGTYCRVGIPAAADMDFKFSWIPTIFTEKKIAGSVVTGTARLAQMMELAQDHLDVFGKDSDKWHTDTVKFEQINEYMAKLKEQKNYNLPLHFRMIGRLSFRHHEQNMYFKS
mmetsp:Transcript_7794/g.11215  ORF Transcript_7794/g.11215 Transcript_7794/m.11215 type:complete len:118 (-) Transcript_7794:241-594(-)